MTSVFGRRAVTAALAACALAGAATSANATQVFFENFNTLNGGLSANNYTVPGFAPLPTQRVDLLHSGDLGISCAGGSGGCLDLESSLGYSRLNGLTGFAAKAGDTVTLSFDMSDSQRGTSQDRFYAGFRFDAVLTGVVLSRDGAWTGSTPPTPATSSVVVVGDIFGPFGFRHYTLSFVAPQDVMVKLALGGGNPGAPAFGTPAPDDTGALLDNLGLDITSPAAAAPEPATWAMMLMGFGGLGATLRRRRAYA